METTNLSKIRRDKMLNTINEIKRGITDEQTLTNLSMIENELTKKKYGLIWEEHEERVDKELETQIPTFEDVKEKAYAITPVPGGIGVVTNALLIDNIINSVKNN